MPKRIIQGYYNAALNKQQINTNTIVRILAIYFRTRYLELQDPLLLEESQCARMDGQNIQSFGRCLNAEIRHTDV